MVSAISSIENLNVNERIQTKSVTPVSHTKNQDDSESGSANVKSLNLEDYTYGQHTPKTADKKESTKEVESNPINANANNNAKASTNTNASNEKSPLELEKSPLEEEGELQMANINSGGGTVTTAQINSDQGLTSQTLNVDILKSNDASQDLLEIPSTTAIKTIVINVKDENGESVVKNITVDQKGNVLKEETQKASNKPTTMKEEKGHIENLRTNFQQKRQTVESLMFQLKQSIASGKVDDIHYLTSVVNKSISSLRSDATALYNKVYLYETGLYSGETSSGTNIIKNTADGMNSQSQNNNQANTTDQATDQDSQSLLQSVEDIANQQTVVSGNNSSAKINLDLASPPENTLNIADNIADNNNANSNKENVTTATNIDLAKNNTSSKQAYHNVQKGAKNNNVTDLANSANTQAYVQNIPLTEQVAAAASLTLTTGALDIMSISTDPHRSHISMHNNPAVDLDTAVEEVNQTEASNQNSSNSDRHDNHETYQQQDMDSGYNSHAINVYSQFNNKNNNEFREKQRKLNNLRYERNNTDENIDLMEDQFNRLTSESNRVINEEKIISKAPTDIRNQMKQEAISRREQRLSFM